MERINVAVRARPLSLVDAKTSPWRISGNSIFFANPPTKFEFDRIFREDSRTVEVYESRTKDIVHAAVGGFNGTVFAYGQTNSGKTHTMRGSTSEPGVIPLAVHDLFDMIEKEMDREFLLRMSYMEIYNEEINDLLAPEHRKLQIHESIERGIFVAGLREEIVTSPKQVLEFMEFGEAHRHIGDTNMNLHSSRSHTIFRMIIESRDKAEDEYTESLYDAVRVSVLNLVDLAGSERAAKTGAEGVRLKEGSHINKSLMTLGTVIKKLSEGAESQGGHVPYRDSKLTRILQPALGGNANTAIICNITLAQVHADETKSSLQFASRALRVTNCVHVNEILTDAALLKRQKKEIEELRAKLQGSHSDRLGEEILNLRNTLLQSELERERIALELEEEKKAQAERERRLLEQAKKIHNLSSMVLCSNRDEIRDHRKKKRRDTWCPGTLSKEALHEELQLPSNIPRQASALKPMRAYSERGQLLPFEKLVNDESTNETCKQVEGSDCVTFDDCSLPDPRSLLHVTSRKKALSRKKSLARESDELKELRAEYEDLLLKFETQRTMSDVQISYLTRRLAAETCVNLHIESEVNYASDINKQGIQFSFNESSKELEAVPVINQLLEKISMLEMVKSSSLPNFDPVVESATKQNICARNKYEEDGDTEFLAKLSADIQDIVFDVQHSRTLIESVTSMMDIHLLSYTELLKLFADLWSFSSHNSMLTKTLLGSYEQVCCSMKTKVDKLEQEKLLLSNQSADSQKRIEEAWLSGENSVLAITELSEQHEAEKSQLLSEIRALQNEVSHLSSSALAKEMESMRKDLDKTKAKLKETEFKLRNTIQEKAKLEGEKAFAEREIKCLHGQMAILERDINKRETNAGRRRDSFLVGSSNSFDSRKPKGLAVTIDQEDYRKLEVLAFEMETTIASLEEKLTTANNEKQEAMLRADSLVVEVQELSDRLIFSNSELCTLEKLVSSLRSNLDQVTLHNQNVDSSISNLVDEKEEMALQLTDVLLAIEEERAISSAKEKVSVEAIESKSKLYRAEIASLTDAISEARNELQALREERKIIGERLAFAEERLELEKTCSLEKTLENERLRNDLVLAAEQSKTSAEILKSKLEMLSLDHRNACEEVDKLRMESHALGKQSHDWAGRGREFDPGSALPDDVQISRIQLVRITKQKDELMALGKGLQNCKVQEEILGERCDDRFLNNKAEVDELTVKLSALGAKIHDDKRKNNIEKAKLRMRLKGAQTKLDTLRLRYKEEMNEKEFMHTQYEAATMKMKGQLATFGVEVLNLKKQLAGLKGL